MKRKEVEQKKRKKELKRQRRQAKSLDRKEPSMQEKPTILIVCEGKNTEPSYFNNFKLSSATVKSIGEGYNTLSLVDRTIELCKNKNYDKVWCVFDKDDFNDKDFNGAITLARRSGFGVAYSNQAFEYWILLHFNDHQGAQLSRNLYTRQLKKYLKPFKLSYDGKSKIISDELFDLLESKDKESGTVRRILAIRRAKRNYNQLTHQNPAQEESSTTVFQLVEELDKYR